MTTICINTETEGRVHRESAESNTGLIIRKLYTLSTDYTHMVYSIIVHMCVLACQHVPSHRYRPHSLHYMLLPLRQNTHFAIFY